MGLAKGTASTPHPHPGSSLKGREIPLWLNFVAHQEKLRFLLRRRLGRALRSRPLLGLGRQPVPVAAWCHMSARPARR